MSSVYGAPAYHAGTSGTLTLAAAEKVIAVWCVATAGGATLAINGGDAIPLPSNIPFAFALESGDVEYVGASLVFTGTASYFVKTRT